MITLDCINDELFVARDSIISLGAEETAFVKSQAMRTPRGRARICAHRSNGDALHEMLIAISRQSYIHPHKHLSKSESFHIVEGIVDVVIFDDQGAITDVIALGAFGSGRSYFYRLSESRFHTLHISSELLVVHEVTNGPFDKRQTILAPFAPDEHDTPASLDYRERLASELARFQSAGNA